MNLFDITPITFVLDLDDDTDTSFDNFLKFYLAHIPKSLESMKKPISELRRKFRNFVNIPNPHEKKINVSPFLKPKMKSIYVNGDNYLWLLKPTGFNRGRGIQIFTTLEQLEK